MRYIIIFFLSFSSLFAQYGQAGDYGNTPGGASASSSSWVPTDDPTLNLWLRADDLGGLDSSVVSGVWPDTSGNGFDATPFDNPYLIKNALNGHSVVRFDAVNDYFYGTTDTLQQFSFYAVYNTNTNGTYHGLYSQIPTSPYKGWNIIDHATASYTAAEGGTSSRFVSGASSGSKPYHVRSFIAESDSVKSYVNGSYVGGQIKDIIYASLNYAIGRYYSSLSSFYLNGDVAEILIFAKSHSATERAQVEAYLTAKYFPDQSVPMDNLQLWLVADDISGADASTITQKWPDNSYYFGRDASPNGNPTIEVSEINGHRMVNFDGVGDYFSGTTDTTDTFSFFVVYKSPSPSAHGASFSMLTYGSDTRGGWTHRLSSTAGQKIEAGNLNSSAVEVVVAPVSSTSQLISYIGDGSKIIAYVDGDSTQEASITINFGSKTFHIGNLYVDSPSFYLQGYIAEILVYNTNHDATTRASIESYLNTKYSVY